PRPARWHTDQPQAARMPSETSVSIEEDRCLAWRSAAAWNGHAAQAATGTAVVHPGHVRTSAAQAVIRPAGRSATRRPVTDLVWFSLQLHLVVQPRRPI